MADRRSTAQSRLVWGVALVAGSLSTFAGTRPTEHVAIDAVLTFCFVAFTVWCASTARTWIVMIAGGVVAAAAIPRVVPTVLGLGAVALLATLDLRGVRRRWTKAVAGAAVVLASLLLPDPGGVGSSALVAALVAGVLVVSGVLGKPRTIRRRTYAGLGAVALVGVLTAAGTVQTMLGARSDLESGQSHLRDALDALDEGDSDAAEAELAASVDALASARASLARPWGLGGAALPIVAQHRDLARGLTSDAERIAVAALTALETASPEDLRDDDGRFAVETFRSLDAPFTVLADATADLLASLDEYDSPWLFEVATRQLDELRDELAGEDVRTRRIADAVRLTPGLLGDEAERRFLVAFITPAEARALGGHMSNFAELTLDDGELEMSRFGRTTELIAANADPATRVLDGPAEYLARYGGFGAGGNGEPSAERWWLSLTISPDFPSVAQVMRQLYESGTGREIDGVIAIDPRGLAALLRTTGPVTVPATGTELDAQSIVPFLLREQYLLAAGENDNDARIDLLGDVAEVTFDRFLTTPDLDLVGLVTQLAGAASGGHVMFWSTDAEEQALFEELGASGRFAPAPTGDSVAVTNLNSSGSKIDAFLRREVHYEATIDPVTGSVTGTVEVTLHNDAPATGLPNYVIGNATGEPLGTNRTYVNLYSTLEIGDVTLDGRSVEPFRGVELGWNHAERRLTLDPGGTAVLRYDVSGTVDPTQPYELFVRAQPTAIPDEMTIDVRSTDGTPILEFEGTVRGSFTVRQAG